MSHILGFVFLKLSSFSFFRKMSYFLAFYFEIVKIYVISTENVQHFNLVS